MNTYDGILISEVYLLIQTILFTLLLLALLIATAFLLFSTLNGKDKKQAERIKKLKERAAVDATAKKQLEKIEQKRKRGRKKKRGDLFYNVFLFSLAGGWALLILCTGIIPGWTDYAVKDYVVYTGEIEVCDNFKRPYITLEDGTTVHGNVGFEESDTYGTIVYTKRTKIVLGGQK